MKFIATPVKGTNDYLPADVQLRRHVQRLIRESYAKSGFDSRLENSMDRGAW